MNGRVSTPLSILLKPITRLRGYNFLGSARFPRVIRSCGTTGKSKVESRKSKVTTRDPPLGGRL